MPKVLVVDDEVRIREMVRDILSAKGYKVVTVASAEHAITTVFEKPFDLVLLDIKLTDESGISVLKKIRKTNKKLPIVIYSGHLTAELEKEARISGANEVLSKDTSLAALAMQVEKIIKAKDRIFEDTPIRKEKSILIVDDEENVRSVLSDFFNRKNFKTLEAKNGEEALAVARSETFSMVLLDINMPGMSGLTVLQKLLEINSKLGVIIVTGNQNCEDAKKAVELGAYGYVTKPFEFLYLELVVMSKLIIADGDA